MDVDKLIQALDSLPSEDYARVQAHLAEHPRDLSQADAETWATTLDAAVTEFRKGLSEEEIEEITDAMTAKHIRPEDFE